MLIKGPRGEELYNFMDNKLGMDSVRNDYDKDLPGGRPMGGGRIMLPP